MRERDRYPIGQQDFKTLRVMDAFYVDKTPFIEKILNSNTQYYFLARPRRFGKSLFLSTLRYFFEGERDLFKGLRIDSLNYDWQKYPVLYLDLNGGDYTNPENLDTAVDYMLSKWEDNYEIAMRENDAP